MTNYGQQDASQQDELRGRLALSPTGRQLARDGSFVKATYTTDPAKVLIAPGDGVQVLWDDTAGSGHVFDCTFLRSTGWLYVQIS